MTRQLLIPATLAGVTALVGSLVLTPLVRGLGRRIGAVANPKLDRWHTKATAMLGGVAIVIAVVIPALILVPLAREGRIVIAASVALFLVGLAEDRKSTRLNSSH